MNGLRDEQIALIGFGAIGSAVERILRHEREAHSKIAGILVRPGFTPKGADANVINERLWVTDISQLLDRKPALVVECAGHGAVDQYAQAALSNGSDLLLASVGALADAQRLANLTRLASESGRQILLPAGAIAGVDWLAASRRSGLDRVVYRSRKPPSAWRGTPAQAMLSLEKLQVAQTFFSGNARDAAVQYPKNANVAATIALAGKGFEGTQVQLIADPNVAGNMHEIEASGPAGELRLSVLGQPDPDNPKTSMLTAYSIVRAILNRTSAVAL